MKQKFSTKWVGSKQPRKQRKYRANAPLHILHTMISSNLNKELRKKYGKRSFPVRKGDIVKIMRGEFKRKTGKVDSVDVKKSRIMIEGIFRSKKDGSKVGVYFDASNLQIKELNLEDAKRKKAIERKTASISDNKNSSKEQKQSGDKQVDNKTKLDTKKENKEEKK